MGLQRAVAGVGTSNALDATPPTFTLQLFLDSPLCRLNFWLFLFYFALHFPDVFFTFRPAADAGPNSSRPELLVFGW